jgi:hypothetical protein
MGGMGGGTTVVNVTVQGNVLAEDDLAETIQRAFIQTRNRNGSLEFG